MTEFRALPALLRVMGVLKEAQLVLEASNVPNFMVAGRTILNLLYLNQDLNEATNLAAEYVVAFRTALVAYVDEPHLMLEWGVAAYLDARQRKLERYKLIWEKRPSYRMVKCLRNWRTHGDFVQEVKESVHSYALGLVPEEKRALWTAPQS